MHEDGARCRFTCLRLSAQLAVAKPSRSDWLQSAVPALGVMAISKLQDGGHDSPYLAVVHHALGRST